MLAPARSSLLRASAAAAAAAAPRALIHNSSSTAVSIGNLQRPGDGAPKTVTVLPGQGIGPELVQAAMKVTKAAGAPILYEVVDNIRDKLTPEALASFKKNGVCLKGEFVAGIGKGTPVSVNIELRKQFQMYANVVHSFNMPGISYRHDNVDIVIIRENTEGEYSGMEHEVAPGITESLKVMTRDGTRRIAQYAFEYAFLNNRAKVTAVHKANIMKKADGVFLESCQEVAKLYPTVEYEEVIVDNCMMQLVSKPQQFDVMVTPNFYGSLVTNTVAGLVGGAGVSPGANIGAGFAMFEQGARHVALDIAGKDVVNPTGILFSTVMMLRHLKLPVFAERIEAAIFETLKGGLRTRDIGGSASTSAFVEAICTKLSAEAKDRAANKRGKGVSKAV
jgi:isocitrate dehydrogenase (NAD+)